VEHRGGIRPHTDEQGVQQPALARVRCRRGGNGGLAVQMLIGPADIGSTCGLQDTRPEGGQTQTVSLLLNTGTLAVCTALYEGTSALL
jgi:hypothetical protein